MGAARSEFSTTEATSKTNIRVPGRAFLGLDFAKPPYVPPHTEFGSHTRCARTLMVAMNAITVADTHRHVPWGGTV